MSDERWTPDQLYGWVPDAVRRVDRRQKFTLLGVAVNVAVGLFLLATALYWLVPVSVLGIGIGLHTWQSSVVHRRWLVQLYKERTGAELK